MLFPLRSDRFALESVIVALGLCDSADLERAADLKLADALSLLHCYSVFYTSSNKTLNLRELWTFPTRNHWPSP